MSACNDFSYFSISRWACKASEGVLAASTDFDPGKILVTLQNRVIEIFNKLDGDSGAKFNKDLTEFLHNADFSEIIQRATKDLDFSATHIRSLLIGQIDKLREDLQQISANVVRDTALKMMPWVALTLSIAYGTPLLVHYAYQKAVHNIGRPKLATEVRHVDWYNKAYDATLDAISATWDTAKLGAQILSGVVYAEVAGALGATLMHQMNWLAKPDIVYNIYDQLNCQLGSTEAASYRATMKEVEEKVTEYEKDWMGVSRAVPRTVVHQVKDTESCENSELTSVIQATIGVSFAIMLAYGLKYAAEMAANRKIDPRPIFNPDLTRTIDEITKSTYNLQMHNGYFQNVLLYGPGGTGKTMISKVIARNSNMNYVMMSGGDLAQYIKRGEHVTELNKLFESAKSNITPTIIFIDEAESLCRDRNALDKPELIELLNAFLNHTGEQTKKFMIIMATNRMEDIDPAVLSRMDQKLYIGPPQEPERKKILQEYIPRFFSKKEIKNLFSDEILDEISKETDGLTGRALFKMVNAIASTKMASNDNSLQKEMIDRTVQHFVQQEKQVEKLREAAERRRELRNRISMPDNFLQEMTAPAG